MAADVTTTNTVETSAEQVDYTTTHNNTSTEQVDIATTRNTTSTEKDDFSIPTISPTPTTITPTTPATTTPTAKTTTIANNPIATNNWSGHLKQQLNANLFNLNNKIGKKGNKSFNHY